MMWCVTVSCICLGSVWNPRVCGVDVKMILYNIGAVGLLVNILSCASANYYYAPSSGSSWGSEQGGEKTGQQGLTLAMLLYTLMFCWFLTDYVMFEKVHLYTYGTHTRSTHSYILMILATICERPLSL